ncbi:MAG: metallophosphoesterase, partial [Gammaproteobacteria bacterium]|nr:metallophosphoesterase [Gammaproteobacteria bacterium]
RDDALQVERVLDRMTLDDESFVVLMYHRPHGFEAAARKGIDLMLSGHTHNGQIFPFHLVVKSAFDRVAGLYELGQSRLYVSQGTGTWGPVMRVGTRAEITLFEYEGSRD